MDYVTDTCALIWYFTNDPRLGRKALDAFETLPLEGTIIVPTIVLAEYLYISKKKLFKLSFENILETIEQLDSYIIYPLNSEVLRMTARIEANLEIHDKLIVATAKLLSLPLITNDTKIRESRMVDIVW